MKKTITSLLLLAGLWATAQVKIGDNPTTINASTVLEVESTTKGFLPPRMTTAQRNAISSPATGLAVYNTTSNSLEVNTGTPASPVWSSAKAGNVSNASLTSSTSPAGTSVGQMMYNTGAVQPTGLVYWDGTQWKSVASSGGDTTNNYPVTNNSTVTNNNPVTNNSTSTFNGVSTFNDQAVFNDTAVFNGGMKVGNLPQGAVTDSLMVFEPNTKEVRRLSISGIGAAGEPWYKVGTTSGATANTDDVFISGKVGVGSATPIEQLDVTGNLILRGSALNGGRKNISLRTSAGLDRWALGMEGVETGSGNGGADFRIWNYADNGSFLTTSLNIQRSTGYVSLGTNNYYSRLSLGGFQASTSTTYDPLLTLAGTDGPIGELYHRSNGSSSYLGLNSNDAAVTTATPIVLNENGGRVGIGTNSPTGKLHLAGDASVDFVNSSVFTTNTGTNGHTWAFGARPLGTAGDFAINDVTDGATRVTVQGGTGNVGIGTTAPIAKLDVASGAIVSRVASVASGSVAYSISNLSGTGRWGIGTQTAESGSNSGGDFNIWNYADNGSYLSSPMTISRATGYVGIKHNAPKAPLHIGSGTSASFTANTYGYFDHTWGQAGAYKPYLPLQRAMPA